ncbi:MAG: nucleotidyltransferase domain-containing protein [Desulfosporosinus sp.]|nr:nucleotidyltransferase domain-containing protein [Desulfosporosinus sp.]
MRMIILDEELIRSIREIGRNYAVEQIVLFGSRARGDHKPVSDIDLAVFLLPKSNCIGRLASDIEDLNTLLKIDTIFINENIDPKLLENIKKEGVLLYERTKHKSK